MGRQLQYCTGRSTAAVSSDNRRSEKGHSYLALHVAAPVLAPDSFAARSSRAVGSHLRTIHALQLDSQALLAQDPGLHIALQNSDCTPQGFLHKPDIHPRKADSVRVAPVQKAPLMSAEAQPGGRPVGQ